MASAGRSVIIGQLPLRDWSSGVFACCEDVAICLCGTFIPCILTMKVAGDMDENVCLCLLPGTHVAMRTKIRIQENIQGSICNDCLLDTFCGPCTLCQLAREVKMIKAQQGRH